MGNRLTIELPDAIYERIKQRAANKNRPIEDEVIEAVANSVLSNEKLSNEIDSLIAKLDMLNDKAVWKLARTKMPAKDVNKIHKLHDMRQNRELNNIGEQELAGLMRQYN